MKQAFTTLGNPEWDLATTFNKARELGFDGVDFRGIGPHAFDDEKKRYVNVELDITRNPLFTTGLQKTKDLIAQSGVEVAGLSSSVRLAHLSPSDQGEMIDEAKRYIALAKELGSRFVRIFGGGYLKAGLDLQTATANLVAGLKTIAPIAQDSGVTIAVETHDEWINSAEFAPVLEQVDHPAIGVLWDVHHPYRMIGEAPERTWELLGKWVCYTHIKDSIVNDDDQRGYSYCLTGTGSIPLEQIISILKTGGYDGWLTYEWEKIWHPEIQPADEAYGPHIAAMKKLVDE